MNLRMRRSRAYLKILGKISPIFFMMNDFVSIEQAPQLLRHNKSMFSYITICLSHWMGWHFNKNIIFSIFITANCATPLPIWSIQSRSELGIPFCEASSITKGVSMMMIASGPKNRLSALSTWFCLPFQFFNRFLASAFCLLITIPCAVNLFVIKIIYFKRLMALWANFNFFKHGLFYPNKISMSRIY